MIEFQQVGKRYPGGFDALADVSFTVAAGELVVLSGHSGAGKTTLLRLIPAIERPTAGRVLLNGQDVGHLRRSAIPYLRRKLGLVLHEHRLLADRSVFTNVVLPLEIAGHSAKEAGKRAQAALERVGLADKAKERPMALSGGEQQRAAIARAIVNRPAILIADEPTAQLDADYAREIAGLFRSFNAAGVTVLVATHDAQLFAAARPRSLRLAQGRIQEDPAS